MQTGKTLRWLALLSVLANVAFNYVYASDGTMVTVTDTYRTVFRPAGYAFSIWGLIYLSWIAFCIYQLLPGQLKNPAYNDLSNLVIVSSLLSVGWLTAFTNNHISASMLLIVVMLAAAVLQLRKAYDIVTGASANKWLVLMPFSLYAGWLSVATIANAFIWVKAMNWDRSVAAEEIWATALVVAAGIIGAIVAFVHRNPFFPLVIAWASMALKLEQGSEFVLFGNTCLVVAIAMVLAGIYQFSRQWPERKMVL